MVSLSRDTQRLHHHQLSRDTEGELPSSLTQLQDMEISPLAHTLTRSHMGNRILILLLVDMTSLVVEGLLKLSVVTALDELDLTMVQVNIASLLIINLIECEHKL